MHIKKGDKVQVIAGKEKGQIGNVLRIDRGRNRVVVEGLNLVKRHKRPSAADQEGGIIEKEAPLHASNLLLYSEKLEKGVRVSHRFVGSAGEHFATKKSAVESFDAVPARIEKIRVCVKTGEVL
jgi:large subunit ribosomal protein L24